jgi:hypothetical protein
MNETAKTYSEAQATDEAVLLFTRKVRRLIDRETFAKIWKQLPDGAKEALYAAERRADVLRDTGDLYTYQVTEGEGEE